MAPTRDSRHNGASFTPSSNVWESKKVATRRSQRGLQAIRSSARLSLRGGQERLPRTSAHALSRQRLRALRARSIPLHVHAVPGDVRSHSRLVIRRRNGGRTTALLRVNAHRDRSRADLTEKSRVASIRSFRSSNLCRQHGTLRTCRTSRPGEASGAQRGAHEGHAARLAANQHSGSP